MTKILLAVCNICLASDTQSAATHTEKLTFNGVEYEIDMCDDHHLKWFKPFAAELEDHGTRVGGRKTTVKPKRETLRDPQQCEIGDCVRMVDGFHGQVQHIRQGHPEEYEEWRAKKDKERA